MIAITEMRSIANVKENHLSLEDIHEMVHDEASALKYSLVPGDILVSAGQSLLKVGESAIYRGELPGAGFQKNVFRFRVFANGCTPDFAQLVFRAWVQNGTFRRSSSISTNLAYMSTDRFADCPFPIPPRAEQAAIASTALGIMDVGESVRSQTVNVVSEHIRQLDAAILAKAFRGELVPQDPHDEPASVLLERLKAVREAAAPRKKTRAVRRLKK